MLLKDMYVKGEITKMAKELFKEERSIKRLDGWFLIKEMAYKYDEEYKDLPMELKSAKILKKVAENLPLSISSYQVFAGTQRDAFAKTYALINPAFEVESFSGYCDPTAVFGDIESNNEFTTERIKNVHEFTKNTDYVKNLNKVYENYEDYTEEVAFFMEQVTGHVIPDFRTAIALGVSKLIEEINHKLAYETDENKKINYESMKFSLESVVVLAHRYADIANEQQKTATGKRKEQLAYMEKTLRKVPEFPAENLYEAIQSFLLLWQLMCLEQAPNPFAFSVGNADRIFEPYRKKENLDLESASELFKHFLVYFNVGDRSWAISQNVIIGGKGVNGEDLTSPMSYAILDAYYDMNMPQPILSVKLHKNTPDELYMSLGKFFFTPGCLTPSLFNDDALFETLEKSGVEKEDLPDYSIAGCQEPLIMGKDNGNTTNSWLNLGKILELTLNGGASTITGKQIGPKKEINSKELLINIRSEFYNNVEFYVDKMIEAANDASIAISYSPVPFLSVFMGGINTGYDMRDTKNQGTKYNGSGCLIHGLSVIADSFTAIDKLLQERPEDSDRLLKAIRENFANDKELHEYVLSCPKFGNNIEVVDKEAAIVAGKISDLISSKKNYLGNPFRPDWSTPSTHLLYGYWTGATPDGRKAREMLNYGVDPLYGEASQGLGFRVLSSFHLPYDKMNGGYASHFGIDPKFFKAPSYEGKGMEFRNRIFFPLFFNEKNEKTSPFYLYLNITTPETLRKVLAEPEKYAPTGVYIMRIHGTFVNFLDLSPAIQNDIINRLDLESTSI